jgi:hypothetical protein
MTNFDVGGRIRFRRLQAPAGIKSSLYEGKCGSVFGWEQAERSNTRTYDIRLDDGTIVHDINPSYLETALTRPMIDRFLWATFWLVVVGLASVFGFAVATDMLRAESSPLNIYGALLALLWTIIDIRCLAYYFHYLGATK